MFGEAPKADPEPAAVKTLDAKIGALTLENDPAQDLRGPPGATIPAAMSGAFGKAGLLARAGK
ncbi:hypothetical protein [Paenirhodobacter sp.]|uniref:hypothetical protein n=1 Tax=Paenirhodobacter sp. TaxID=1965326 RepID=UPI003B3EB452